MTAHVRIEPGYLREEAAAAYCQLSRPKFIKAVAMGELPAPVIMAGEKRWSRIEIDQIALKRAGLTNHDWFDDSPLYKTA